MKKCLKCGEERQDEFYSYQTTRCKQCIRNKQLAFNRKNPDYLKAKNQRRRARLKSLPDTLSTKQWTDVQKRFKGKCFLTDSTDTVLEHVIPTAWGHGGTTVENVLPMDAKLNLAKRDKNFLEWFNKIDASLEMHDRFDEAIEYLAALNGLTADEYLEFVYWCEENKRTVEEVQLESRSSVELFKETFVTK